MIALVFIIAIFGYIANSNSTPIQVFPVTPEKPAAQLQTVQKVILWFESDSPKLPYIKHKRRCTLDPAKVIVTDAEIDLKATKKCQKAGAKVALLVHPFYSPWNQGKTKCLELVAKNAEYYDYIALDYEGPLADVDFVKQLQKFGKPLIVAPMARGDAMKEYYEGLSQLENCNFLWWNYSADLSDWNNFFATYKFPESNRHNVLLSVGEKYRKSVSDQEIRNIVINLPHIRAGIFNPKTDYAATRKIAKNLEQQKTTNE
ncbi:MAG: hypothetical protein PF692_15880 [Kiritimatiellae bacterium]|nr:hypothetical protein [Kiritimatiellia bacterium]